MACRFRFKVESSWKLIHTHKSDRRCWDSDWPMLLDNDAKGVSKASMMTSATGLYVCRILYRSAIAGKTIAGYITERLLNGTSRSFSLTSFYSSIQNRRCFQTSASPGSFITIVAFSKYEPAILARHTHTL